MKALDLDNVCLSPRAVHKWHNISREAVRHFPRDTTAAAIPDEQCLPQEDGTLLIFVDVPSHKRIHMTVPAEEWSYNH